MSEICGYLEKGISRAEKTKSVNPETSKHFLAVLSNGEEVIYYSAHSILFLLAITFIKYGFILSNRSFIRLRKGKQSGIVERG